MRVRMLRTTRGAVDPRGLDVHLHEAGQVYDLPASLAAVYLHEEWAEEDRALDGAPETRDPSRGRRKGGDR